MTNQVPTPTNDGEVGVDCGASLRGGRGTAPAASTDRVWGEIDRASLRHRQLCHAQWRAAIKRGRLRSSWTPSLPGCCAPKLESAFRSATARRWL